MLKRYLPVTFCLILIYLMTAATSGQNIAPDLGSDASIVEVERAWRIFEFKHIIIHASGFALLAWMILQSIPPSNRLHLTVLLLILVFGLGQEMMQSLLRWDVRPLNSALDIASDLGGGLVTVLFSDRGLGSASG